MNEPYFTDGWSFLIAVSALLLVAMGMTRIVDWTKEPTVSQCSITFKTYDGNKHTLIGTGKVWR
jgi:hypothetical protein